MSEVFKRGLLVGLIHGAVIGIGISFVAYKGSVASSFFFGFLAVELVLLIALLIYALKQFSEWTKPGYREYLLVIGFFFLVLSALFLLPTIVISLAVSLAVKSIYA
jgi:hypothetical protein